MNNWTSTNGYKIAQFFKKAESLGLILRGMKSIGERELETFKFTLNTQIEFDAKKLQAHTSSTDAISKINREIEVCNERVRMLEENIASLSGDPEGLIDALAKIIPHIQGDDCPVCQRNFSELSEISLPEHVAERLNILRGRVDILQKLTHERANHKARVVVLGREQIEYKARLLSNEHLADTSQKSERLAGLLTELEALTPAAVEGTRLREMLRTAEQAAQRVAEQDRRTAALRESVRVLAHRYGLPPESAERSIPVTLENLHIHLEADDLRLMNRQKARKAAAVARQELLKNQKAITELDHKIQELTARANQLDTAIKQADDHRKAANRLCKAAVDARTAVIGHVFNNHLNGVWRDLFTRLVPDEPYVPAFAIPDGSADAESILNRVQFESGGLGPCLGARHTHMAAFPEGGSVKTGVTR